MGRSNLELVAAVFLLCVDGVAYALLGLFILSAAWIAAAVGVRVYDRWADIADARVPQRRRVA